MLKRRCFIRLRQPLTVCGLMATWQNHRPKLSASSDQIVASIDSRFETGGARHHSVLRDVHRLFSSQAVKRFLLCPQAVSLDGAPCGVYVEDSSHVLLNGSTIARHEAKNRRGNMIRWKGIGQRNLITGCQIDSDAPSPLAIDDEAGVTLQSNLMDP